MVTVNADPEIIAQPTNKDACVGDGILLGVEASGGSGSYSYQWMESDTENGTFANISGATSSTFSPASDTDYTKYYKVVVKNSDNDCSVTSDVARVTVSPLPVANKATLYVCDMSDEVIGYEPFYLTDAIDEITGGQAGVTVSFHISYDDAYAGINPLSSPFTNQEPWWSMVFARVDNDATGCFSIATVDLYVHKLPDAFDAELYMCDPENDGYETFNLADAAPLVIDGQESVSATFFETLKDAQDSINPLGDTYTNTSATPQVIYARATITSTGCYRVSQLTLNLYPQIEITAQPQDVEVCTGGTATLSVAADGGSGNYSYQWMESDSENGTYINIDGATNSSYSAPTSTAGLKFYKVEVSDNTEGCSNITSDFALVTIKSGIQITSQPQDVEVCINGTATLSVTVDGGSGNY